MTITRAEVEYLLLKRAGSLMADAGLDGTTAGDNTDLNDPIGYATRQLGGTVANLAGVADSDLSGIADTDTDKLLDIAEYRLLETVLTALATQVDINVGPRSESLSQKRKAVEEKLSRLAKIVAAYDLTGAQSLSAGYLSLNFAEHSDG